MFCFLATDKKNVCCYFDFIYNSFSSKKSSMNIFIYFIGKLDEIKIKTDGLVNI